MSPLDVLFVLPSLEHGGAERVSINLANTLRATGHRPRFLLLAEHPGGLMAQVDATVPVVTLAQPRVRRALPEIVRHVRAHPPDVIITTHTHLNLALCTARTALPRSTRLVIREPTHAPLTLDGRSTRWRRRLQRALYRRADLVLATSVPMRHDLARLTRARVELVHNAVDVVAIRASLSSHGPAPTSGRRLVSVGRLSTQKSLPDLLAAFAVASDDADRLVLLGDGPLHDELLDLAAALGVAGRVELRGFISAPWQEIAASDALILASREEGMPNVVLEALAVGTPVIACDELDVLRDLRDAAPVDAVRLVPRAGLADAIRAIGRRPAPGPETPVPDLLPADYRMEESGRRLATLLAEVTGGGVSLERAD